MIYQREVPTSVQAQYVTAMKYAGKKRLEVLVKDGVNHPNIENKDNMMRKLTKEWVRGFMEVTSLVTNFSTKT
jgi:hypothetical protein